MTDSRLVFGQADPVDYMEPLCDCGHMRSEHYDGNGSLDGEGVCCWHGWTEKDEGCQCLAFSRPVDTK